MPAFSVEDAKGERLYLLETRANTSCTGDAQCLQMHFNPISGPYDKATGGKIVSFYPSWETPEPANEDTGHPGFYGTGNILDRYLQVVYPPDADATTRQVIQGAVLLASTVLFDVHPKKGVVSGWVVRKARKESESEEKSD